MTSKGRMRRPSPAMIVAVTALVAAVGGTAIATPLVVKSVLSSSEKRQVKNISKNQAKLAIDDRAPGLSVANAANANRASTAGNADNAALLDNFDSSGFYRYGSSIPSGTTVTGAFGGQDTAGAAAAFFAQAVGFPVPAPDGLTDAEVNFDNSNAAKTGDEDTTCTGSPTSPTAPAGKVCLYPTTIGADVAADSADGTRLAGSSAGTGSRFGFGVDASSTAGNAAIVEGVWAYTAP